MTQSHTRSADTNRALVHRFFDEVFNQRSGAALAEIVGEGFVGHHPAFPQGIRGRAGLMQVVEMFHAGFDGLRYVVEDLVAEADRVAVRWTATGKHTGLFMGVPPTDRDVAAIGTDIFRAEAGRLVEAWVNSDLFGLFVQLGSFPPPPGQGRAG